MNSTRRRPGPRPLAAEEPVLATRERLLRAALEVLESEGIHALTQTRVAERAGLRQSHLTYHFATRADLLKAIVEQAAAAGPPVLGSAADVAAPTLSQIRAHLGACVTDVRMARLMLALTTASDEDPSLKRWMVEFDARVRADIGAVLGQLGHRVAAQELALFHSTLVGIAVLHSSESTPAAAREARRLVALAFDRLIASSSHP